MTTKTIDTKQINQKIDLRDLGGRYTELRGGQADELYGPCPKCGGEQRFHCKADWWFCRDCYKIDNGLSHDPIAFVMWIENLDFKNAVAWLTNTPMPITPTTKRAPTPSRRAKGQPDWCNADWQRKNLRLVRCAHGRLFNDSDQAAQTGRDYLVSRGLDPHTWQKFNIGFALCWHSELGRQEPAIVLPWYTATGRLRGVRFRFLYEYQIGEKNGKPIMSRKNGSVEGGGQFTGAFFGSRALGENVPKWSMLIIVEGEINAMSIWQLVHNTHVDVLSLGGESSHITSAMAAYAAKYNLVLLWMDKGALALAITESLPGIKMDDLIQSPGGQDANDLLQAGQLGEFLALRRFMSARDGAEQQRLLWDLWDAARLPMGLDDSTTEIMGLIAKRIEVSI